MASYGSLVYSFFSCCHHRKPEPHSSLLPLFSLIPSPSSSSLSPPQNAVKQLLQSLPFVTSREPSQPVLTQQLLEDFAEYVLNESCTTVTNTSAKTAVQLVFGKANLVLVRPSPGLGPENNQPVEIVSNCQDSTIVISVSSSW